MKKETKRYCLKLFCGRPAIVFPETITKTKVGWVVDYWCPDKHGSLPLGAVSGYAEHIFDLCDLPGANAIGVYDIPGVNAGEVLEAYRNRYQLHQKYLRSLLQAHPLSTEKEARQKILATLDKKPAEPKLEGWPEIIRKIVKADKTAKEVLLDEPEFFMGRVILSKDHRAVWCGHAGNCDRGFILIGNHIEWWDIDGGHVDHVVDTFRKLCDKKGFIPRGYEIGG